MNRGNLSLVVLSGLIIIGGFLLTGKSVEKVFNSSPDGSVTETRFEARVNTVLEEREIELGDRKQKYQKLELESLGQDKLKVEIEVGNIPAANLPKYKTGDKVVVLETDGGVGQRSFFIMDFVRRDSLIYLTVVFLLLVIVVAKGSGVKAILGMGLTFLVIFYFLLPRILNGSDPIVISIIAGLIIIPATFFITHGVNRKSGIAVLGTLLALLITGFFAEYFVEISRLTGFASEEASFLQLAKPGVINIRGLILAGIIISMIGILDDTTIAQAGIVEQLKKARKDLSFGELYKRAMSVGRDHIASVVNTLVLVYTGAALPLLLLFINNPRPFGEVVNYEIIAEEIIRALISSVGLILAVPITTALAAFYFSQRKSNDSGSGFHGSV